MPPGAPVHVALRLAKDVAPDVEPRDELRPVGSRDRGGSRHAREDHGGGGRAAGREQGHGREVRRVPRPVQAERAPDRAEPLSDVIELETLLVGITGKAALWQTLAERGTRADVDLQELLSRASQQQSVVGRCRDSAALKAFATRS
jgi:hypothetical protein